MIKYNKVWRNLSERNFVQPQHKLKSSDSSSLAIVHLVLEKARKTRIKRKSGRKVGEREKERGEESGKAEKDVGLGA